MDLRSGGMGGGKLEAPRYNPPAEWNPRIITSDKNGITVVVYQAEPNTPRITDTEVPEKPINPTEHTQIL